MKKGMALLMVGSLGLLTVASGCGTNDPYSVLQQNYGDMLPGLNLPMPTSVSYTELIGFGVSGSDGFRFENFTYAVANPQITAPAAGTVEYIDPNLNPGFYAVTIYHSALLSSRVSGLQTTSSIQIGSYVNQGDVIGTMPTIATGVFIQLDVYPNGGAAACPLSYLSSAARQTLQQFFGSQFPCVD